jgi:hypothetical protein
MGFVADELALGQVSRVLGYPLAIFQSTNCSIWHHSVTRRYIVSIHCKFLHIPVTFSNEVEIWKSVILKKGARVIFMHYLRPSLAVKQKEIDISSFEM